MRDDRLARLRAARLYLVCDGRRPEGFLDAVLGAGVDVVQLRDKDASDDDILAAAPAFRAAADRHGALFIVNDRPDLALAARADGVHVGQDDGTLAAARAVVGDDAIVGRSTHSPAQADAAQDFDYIACGPVHATPTKPGRPAVGLELIRHAATTARVPWFAIGGIDAATVDTVREAGAERIVVVRALTEASDPACAARALRDAVAGEAGAAAGRAVPLDASTAREAVGGPA